MQKVWDITKPKTAWERAYAKFAYEAEGLRQVATKRIEVKTPGIVIDQFWLQRGAEMETWAAEDRSYGE